MAVDSPHCQVRAAGGRLLTSSGPGVPHVIRASFPNAARLTAAVFALALACPTAEAQVKPFKVTGGGTAPLGISLVGADSPHDATGTATHVGRYSGDEGNFNLLSFDPATGAGTFEGSFVFVAKNGDRLAFTYGDTDNGADEAGQFQVFPAGGGNVVVVFLAEFNPIPAECTGRFKGVVDGSFTMLAMTEPFPLVIDDEGRTPPFAYSWDGEGWIEFKK